jgi:hypothetical protein
MKFLMFNLVVAGALVYLFTADRADVHAAADRVYETADEIKSVARNAVGKGRRLLQGDEAAPARPIPSAPQARPQIQQIPVPKAAPVPPPVKQVARRGSIPNLSPEVIRRRDEVLGNVSPSREQAAIPEIKKGENFMSAAQRQKELFSLAEEMELLYARKISQ